MKAFRGIGIGVTLAMALSVSASAVEMSHWALIRDEAGEVIGTIEEGEEVEVLGTYEENASRSYVYYPAGDLTGTVASVYIYGGTDEEYENPNDYVYEGEGVMAEKDDEDEYGYDEEYEDYTEEDEGSYEASFSDIWVDVSITDQIVTVYDGDEVILSDYCVTGTAGVTDTPTGTFPILYKTTSATLSGTGSNGDYSHDVVYWMVITDWGVGLHDASWRNGEFGGDIYTYDGSQGCINLEYSTAEAIYGLVEEGTPVVIHY